MIASTAGRKENAINPFLNLKIAELNKELLERGILNDVAEENKPAKEQRLKQELSGVARLPALSFGSIDKKMSELNLQSYEVSPCEPLHDTKGHIKNVWEALLDVLDGNDKRIFQESLQNCYGSKAKVRGSDYRYSTIIVYNNLKDSCSRKIKELLYTLQEINRLAYQKSTKRSPKYILRIHNVTFRHAVACISVFGKNPKLTKLYGQYFHSITTHLPEVARIISPSSLHTEQEERIFSALNGISASTSSRKLESLRDNNIIRIQAEQKFQEQNYGEKVTLSSMSSKISKFSHASGILLLYILLLLLHTYIYIYFLDKLYTTCKLV